STALHEPPGVAPSASVGVLMFRGRHPLPALLAQADLLMYRAKGSGKGRLRMCWFGRHSLDTRGSHGQPATSVQPSPSGKPNTLSVRAD
ncbi:MAG: hypothetical protein P3W97_009795, partial [Tepidimonas sp.]|nr:hypothetical protein [Tepidimonas sp.]